MRYTTDLPKIIGPDQIIRRQPGSAVAPQNYPALPNAHSPEWKLCNVDSLTPQYYKDGGCKNCIAARFAFGTPVIEAMRNKYAM